MTKSLIDPHVLALGAVTSPRLSRHFLTLEKAPSKLVGTDVGKEHLSARTLGRTRHILTCLVALTVILSAIALVLWSRATGILPLVRALRIFYVLRRQLISLLVTLTITLLVSRLSLEPNEFLVILPTPKGTVSLNTFGPFSILYTTERLTHTHIALKL